MFTGIIQGQGVIERLTRQAGQCRLTIAPRFDFPDIVDGESIAVNGTCLSVEHHEGSVFSLYASRETMNRTTQASSISSGLLPWATGSAGTSSQATWTASPR